MPFVRVVLFVVILLLLAAAALLWLPFSDEEVPEAINKGSRRLQEEAIELHREGWDALKETRKEINKMSDGLREEILSNVVDGAGQAARCSISSPSLNFFPSKTWTISSEPLSLRQRASA